jgi:hypothetical protein
MVRVVADDLAALHHIRQMHTYPRRPGAQHERWVACDPVSVRYMSAR